MMIMTIMEMMMRIMMCNEVTLSAEYLRLCYIISGFLLFFI